MRTATIVFLVACALVAPGAALAQASASDSIAVREAVQRFHQALARRDSTAALALLADDAVVLEAGAIEPRAEYRTAHLPADIQFAVAVATTTDPLRVVLDGNVAWVSSTSRVDGTFEGRPIRSVSAELAVLTRSATGWQIRAIHWSSRRLAAQ